MRGHHASQRRSAKTVSGQPPPALAWRRGTWPNAVPSHSRVVRPLKSVAGANG